MLSDVAVHFLDIVKSVVRRRIHLAS
jgi:hypothetical protein